ncbi:hypothetical protein FEK35_27160 [Nocardia cyriacigeorgica]|uniref:Uncharacterized protein n=1 Tax=Nocardia cyriacigeorgica TaxID=135487 RepID=A0A5R8P6R4_9NOCA|nr:hypothetical protein FEK35_27160 [Nocardia cyriacigeorgica]
MQELQRLNRFHDDPGVFAHGDLYRSAVPVGVRTVVLHGEVAGDFLAENHDIGGGGQDEGVFGVMHVVLPGGSVVEVVADFVGDQARDDGEQEGSGDELPEEAENAEHQMVTST